ncbi:MAG: hypothetical protein EP343_31565 [Deltaproteobacteria bacterium]|nr:MAG: hypothetical protein EP343_31565 [Deltaproteobacteria bacterium]
MLNRKNIVFSVLFCLGGLLVSTPQASASFEGAWTQLRHRLMRAQLVRAFHRLSADIHRLQKELPKADLPPQREKQLGDVLACMSTFTSVLPLRRTQPGTYLWSWYGISRQLHFLKGQLKTLQTYRTNYHRCLLALKPQHRFARQLKATVVERRARRKLKLYEQAHPTLKRIYNRVKTWHMLLKVMNDRSHKNPRASRYLNLSRLQVLKAQQILLRLQQHLLQREWSRKRRIRSLRVLWELAPNPTKTPLPVETMVPLALTMGTMTISLMGAMGAMGAMGVMDDIEHKEQARKAGLVMTGIAGTSLLALSPVSMISVPQPLAANVLHTLLSVAVVPALGITLTRLEKPEWNHLGWGVLSALPLQLTWLTIGWINQSRWRRIKREWQTPSDSPPPPNWRMGSQLETRYHLQGLSKPARTFRMTP